MTTITNDIQMQQPQYDYRMPNQAYDTNNLGGQQEQQKKVEEDENYAQEGFQKDFDAYAQADVNKAILHAEAQRIRKRKDRDEVIDKKNICECCGLNTEGEQYRLCCGLTELADLGIGFPLYFMLLKYIFLAFSFGSAFGIVMGIVCYYRDEKEYTTLIQKFSVASYGDITDDTIEVKVTNSKVYIYEEDKIPQWFGILHLSVIVGILVSVMIYQFYVLKKRFQIDQDNVSPSDYTLWFKGLGPNIDENELKQ